MQYKVSKPCKTPGWLICLLWFDTNNLLQVQLLTIIVCSSISTRCRLIIGRGGLSRLSIFTYSGKNIDSAIKLGYQNESRDQVYRQTTTAIQTVVDKEFYYHPKMIIGGASKTLQH